MIITLLKLVASTANPSGVVNCNQTTSCDPGLPVVSATSAQLSTILTIVFASLAALSVLMIVVSGLRFVIAQGDASQIAKARKTIIYALAGLAIALSAEAIVALVLGRT